MKLLSKRELVGDPECPLMYRWTIVDIADWKILLHYFLPGADDRDYHDHPRTFLSIGLQGYYMDHSPGGPPLLHGARMVRVIRPEHTHRTVAGPEGCWTLVFTGRTTRVWGFLRDGKWIQWKKYLDQYGQKNMRCP